MKFFENNHAYDYPFQTVTLAYFLRYPNPYSRHVITTDVIDRYVEPATQRLHTTRLHLKKSKIPKTALRLLPKGIVGNGEEAGQSYIIETSVVDPREGWMTTENRNMEWTTVLSVIEKQLYRRQTSGALDETGSDQRRPVQPRQTSTGSSLLPWKRVKDTITEQTPADERTRVNTTVIFHSHIGESIRKKASAIASSSSSSSSATSSLPPTESEERGGFFSQFSSTAAVQRTIELIGVRRTRDGLVRSKQGMNVVLERLRTGGVVGVMEGMHADRVAELGSSPHQNQHHRIVPQNQDFGASTQSTSSQASSRPSTDTDRRSLWKWIWISGNGREAKEDQD